MTVVFALATDDVWTPESVSAGKIEGNRYTSMKEKKEIRRRLSERLDLSLRAFAKSGGKKNTTGVHINIVLNPERIKTRM